MQPKFSTQLAWQQAELLMQPILIRVIDNLRKQLETSSWRGTYEEIDKPYPGYQLCLNQGETQVKVDIWQLCFQVCFTGDLTREFVEIDTRLLTETAEVNWVALENKTQQVITRLFADLQEE